MPEFAIDTTVSITVEALDEAGAFRIAEEHWASIADALVPYEPHFWTKIDQQEVRPQKLLEWAESGDS